MIQRILSVFCILGVLAALWGGASAETECKIPPFITTGVSPNVLIVFDTSASMWNVVWDEHFNPWIQYHEFDRNRDPDRLLPVARGEVVFARESQSCQPDPHRVLRDSSTGRVRLRFTKVNSSSTDICDSSRDTAESDPNGYFYFDRSEKGFISPRDYNPADSNQVKVFLPYAEYSETFHAMAQETWYDYNYLNWIFYRSTAQERESVIRGAGFGGLLSEADDSLKRSRMTRILATKESIKDVVRLVEDVRFGVMRFRGNSGGELIAPIGSRVDEIVEAVDRQWAGGWTPLAETMEDVWDYFSRSDSPIEVWCQKNFVILVTDGLPTKDSDDLSSRMKKNWDLDRGGRLGDSEENVYPGKGSDYLDDIVYYMYEHDARPDLRRDDEKRRIRTLVIGFSIANQLLVDTAFNGNGFHGHHAREWLDPESPLYHRYFYMVGDEKELDEAIDSAMKEISLAVSSGTGVTVMSTEARTDDLIFRASFHPEGWKGYLEALEFREGSDTPGPIRWEAGGMLKETHVEDREVHTALKSPTGIDEKMAFVTVNATAKDLDQTQLFEHLNAANAAEGKDIIRFIRGADVEGFRDRGGHRLGDIIHSSPVVVGAPHGYFNASDYVGFRREHAKRKRMLYVGANDGMLHAFYLDGPEGGKEAWAFIPNNLLGKLRDLTSPDYDDCHEFFVDSTPFVTDVFIDPDGAGPESQQWRTLLIGGERQGGSAYFALDITNPAPDQFKPLWQFSDKRLGESSSRPAVERVKAGDRDKWLGFVGSGFNRDETGDGRGYLFAIDLESGGHFGDPIPLEGDAGNVLTSPRGVDINGDDYADALFAGDHTGGLWRFNITDQTGGTKTYEPIDPVDWERQKLFRTLPHQPITLPVGLSFYCASPADKTCQNLFVYFGTGKFLTTDDKTDFSPQSFYAIKAECSEGSTMRRDDLINRTTNACEEVPDPSKINGWYVDLEAPGERVSSPPLVMRGLVFFLTFVPDEDPCSAGGTTWLYYREFDTGCIPDEPMFAGGSGGGAGDDQKGRPVGKVLIGPGYAPDLVYHARTQDMLIQTSDRAIHAKKLNPPRGSIMNYAWREVFF